ncbi:MAG: hypothetical protein LBK58_05410 [Prevotellaceae bacterium]|jgi:hypothetical protein|nr:hypothetical protein [Prevotellaceae bacterium]
MNCYIDTKSIESLEFKEGLLWDTLIITFRSGKTKTVRRAIDASRELKSYYYKLLEEMEGER